MRANVKERIVHGHAWKFRISTVLLVAAAYFSHAKNPARQARRCLKSLRDLSLLECRRVLVRPIPACSGPRFTWHPADPPPNPYALSYESEQRWSAPPRATTVYFATPKAIRCFGGHKGGMPRLHQASHDLFVTCCFLFLEKTQPSAADDWVIEDIFKRDLADFEKPGDARLVGPDGRAYLLEECLGRYSPAHINNIFSGDLPVRIW